MRQDNAIGIDDPVATGHRSDQPRLGETARGHRRGVAELLAGENVVNPGSGFLFMRERSLDKAARPCHGIIRSSPHLIPPLFSRLEGEGKALLNGSAFTPLTGLERQDHAAELGGIRLALGMEIDPAADELLRVTLGNSPTAGNPHVLFVFDLKKVA
jgi:hypothetical protein